MTDIAKDYGFGELEILLLVQKIRMSIPDYATDSYRTKLARHLDASIDMVWGALAKANREPGEPVVGNFSREGQAFVCSVDDKDLQALLDVATRLSAAAKTRPEKQGRKGATLPPWFLTAVRDIGAFWANHGRHCDLSKGGVVAFAEDLIRRVDPALVKSVRKAVERLNID